MTTIVVWILISISTSYYNNGTVTVIDRFPTAQVCEFVRQNMPQGRAGGHEARCVQATVVR